MKGKIATANTKIACVEAIAYLLINSKTAPHILGVLVASSPWATKGRPTADLGLSGRCLLEMYINISGGWVAYHTSTPIGTKGAVNVGRRTPTCCEKQAAR